ncbi:putative factor [Vibrio angustum S14]|uniref:Putative factor n=1 Tax=Photobacterium angustum (strain S14 / CCUG 15956) TaxID=314292 RepID=Q1ZMD1_PHOAS|nr:putative factor [Vibrio angustum S14] [Photobacterium angustum S14]
MKKHTFRLHTLGACIAVLLTGCGGGSDGSSPSPVPPSPPTPTVKMLAMDGFSVVKPGVRSQVDVANFVRGDQIQLSDATVTGKGCGQPGINGLGLTLTAQQGAHCDYQYTAKQAGSPSTRVHLQVLATSASQPLLPPISGAMTLNDDAKAFDVAALLGSDWQAGDAIVADSVSVQGMEGNQGTAALDGTTITFTPPALAGWNRVVFTVKNSQSGDDKLGVIYITFSDMANQAPIIAQPKYDINANNPAITARSGESLMLDLSQLTDLGITDPEGGDWQLVEVKSFTADVSPADKDAITNKAFTFSAGTVGDHYISYIVADEYNGFTSGLLKLHVAPNEHPAGWSSLVDDNNHTFTAPELYSKVDAQGYKVSAVWDNTVSDTLAGFDAKSGDLYCKSEGLLPTVSDLAALRQAHLNGETLAEDLAQWPLEKTYLASDGDSVKGFNFTTGHAEDYDPSIPYYVTCLANTEMTLNMKRYSVVANGDSVVLATVTQPTGGKGITLEKLSGSLSDNDVNISTDSQGKVTTLTTTSIKAGSYRFKVKDNGDADNALTSPEVTYLADADTATFPDETGLVVTKDNAAADGKAQDTLQVTVEDANGNPVAGLPIRAESLSSDSASVSVSPATTDVDGHTVVKVSDTEAGSVDIIAHVTRPNGEVVESSTASVTFADVPSGNYPCPGGGFACLPVLPSINNPDVWYTPDPDVTYLEQIKYSRSDYTSTYTENGQYGLQGFRAVTFNHTGQAERWCQYLAQNHYHGRSDWTLPSKEALLSLYNEYKAVSASNALFTAKSWPTSDRYWSSSPSGSGFYGVHLYDGRSLTYGASNDRYVSCVSG